MKILLDATTLTKDEIGKVKSKYVEFDIIIIETDEMPCDISGIRWNTLYISKNDKAVYINNPNGVYIKPMHILIDKNVWNSEQRYIDAKARSIDELINGQIFTLFGEKLSYFNNFNLAKVNSTYIHNLVPLDEMDMFFSDTEFEGVNIDSFSLGRYFGAKKRIDNLDIFSKKILKCKDGELPSLNFYKNCLNFFLEVNKDKYDIVQYVPCKDGQKDRFLLLTDSNYIKISDSYESIKSLDPFERSAAVKGHYYIDENDIEYIKEKSILLFDDVVTTASTLREITKLLLNSGASKVAWLTAGKTFNSDSDVISYKCPKCDADADIRFRKKDGNPFIGCSNYYESGCNFTTSINIRQFTLYQLLYNGKM